MVLLSLVIDSNNQEIESEVICDEKSFDDCDLFFYVILDGFSLNYYKINHSKQSKLIIPIKASDPWHLSKNFSIDDKRKIVIHNNMKDYIFEQCQQENSSQCKSREFKINYEHYQSYQGEGQKSGAYIFRPNEKTFSGSIPYSVPTKSTIHQGRILTQITV